MTIDRAIEAWTSLSLTCLRREGDTLFVREGPGGRLAPVWPVSQVLAAAIDVAMLTGDLTDVEGIVRGLRVYERCAGYTPMPGQRRRYYDDNAWIGLCFTQLHLQTGEDRWLRRARRVFSFVREGADADGGVRWVEGRRSRNTCSTAPAAQLALRLRLAGGGPATLTFAQRAMSWLDRTLMTAGGLYADHVDRGGHVDPTLWTYNQGAAVGAQLLLHRTTDGAEALQHAMRTTTTGLRRFGADRVWRHAPAFNAIWFRNLLALDAIEPVQGLTEHIDTYLERSWNAGRDDDGLFTSGGIGSYDGTPAIDAGGLVQLFALRAWPSERLADVC